MKSFTIITLLLLFLNTNAQNCSVAVSNSTFQTKYAQISVQLTDQKKLDDAILFCAKNCLSTNQVSLISSLFLQENYRLEFCKVAYTNTVDKQNFYEVFNSFSTFSAVFKLYDFVSNQNIVTPTPSTEPVDPSPRPILNFPAYNYPSVTTYSGSAGCPSPISDNDFMVLATDVLMCANDDEIMVKVNKIAQNNCLSMAQAMKLASMFQMEVHGLQFLKVSFIHLYDQQNYAAAEQCFTHIPYQHEWLNFCLNFLKPPAPVITCNVSSEEFKGMVKNVNNANFSDKQIEIVKKLNTHHCFTTAQVKAIMNQFSFPANKLDAAEILYDKCLDKEKYYTLKDEFVFPSYQEQFEQIIKKK